MYDEKIVYDYVISLFKNTKLTNGVYIIGEFEKEILAFINDNSKGGYSICDNKLLVSGINNNENTMLDDDINNIIKSKTVFILTTYDFKDNEKECPIKSIKKNQTKIILLDFDFFNTFVNNTLNRKVAMKNPELVDAISKQIYLDDMLRSIKT